MSVNDTGAENVLGGPVHDVKQPVLPGRIADHMRRTNTGAHMARRHAWAYKVSGSFVPIPGL